MKDNVKFFRNMVNSSLDNIHITNELKEKTLKRCKNYKKSRLRAGYVAGICAAIIALTTTGYNCFFPSKLNEKYSFNMSATERHLKDIGNFIKNSIINKSPDINALKNSSKNKYADNKNNPVEKPNTTLQDSKDTSNTDIKNKLDIENATNSFVTNSTDNEPQTTNTKPESEKKQPKLEEDKSTVDSNNTPTTKNSIDRNTDESNKSQAEDNPVISSNNEVHPIDINSVEKTFGQKISIPSYIPEGFSLINIDTPDNISQNFVKMNYKSAANHFSIRQDRNINFNNNIGEKININGICTYLSVVKGCGELRISWTDDNNMQYVIQGNISKDTIISIIKSMDIVSET